MFDPFGDLRDFPFDPPSIIVNIKTHEAIQDEDHDQHVVAESQLRLLLGDATRELYRLTLEQEVDDEDTEDGQGFDVRVDGNNCDGFSSAEISISPAQVDADDEHDPGLPSCSIPSATRPVC